MTSGSQRLPSGYHSHTNSEMQGFRVVDLRKLGNTSIAIWRPTICIFLGRTQSFFYLANRSTSRRLSTFCSLMLSFIAHATWCLFLGRDEDCISDWQRKGK